MRKAACAFRSAAPTSSFDNLLPDLYQMLFQLVQRPFKALLHGAEAFFKGPALLFCRVDGNAFQPYCGLSVLLSERHGVQYFQRPRRAQGMARGPAFRVRK